MRPPEAPRLNTLKPYDLWELARLLRLRTDHGVAVENSRGLRGLAFWLEDLARAKDPVEVQRA